MLRVQSFMIIGPEKMIEPNLVEYSDPCMHGASAGVRISIQVSRSLDPELGEWNDMDSD